MSLRITQWRSVTKPLGVGLVTTWDAWIETLSKPFEHSEAMPSLEAKAAYRAWKLKIPGWAPAWFEPVTDKAILAPFVDRLEQARWEERLCADDEALGRWSTLMHKLKTELQTRLDGGRCLEACVAVSALCIESDGKETIEQALEVWTGSTLFIYTTTGHSPSAPRFRLILALSREVTPSEHALIWRWALARHGKGTIATSEKDCSRLWYWPVKGCETFRNEGTVIDVDGILDEARRDEKANTSISSGTNREEIQRAKVHNRQLNQGTNVSADKSASTQERGLGDETPSSGDDKGCLGERSAHVPGSATNRPGDSDRPLSGHVRDRLSRGDKLKRAALYLDNVTPRGSDDNGGGTDTIRQAGKVGVEFGLSEAECLSLMASRWRASPPEADWSEAWLAKKISVAYKNEKGQFTWEAKLNAEPKPRPSVMASPKPNELPHIQVKVGEVPRATDEAIEALKADTSIYVRDFKLVHIIESHDADSSEDHFIAKGTPMIRSLHRATIGERLSLCAYWETYDARIKNEDGSKGALKRTDPPDSVVSAVVAREHWPSLNPIAGIVEAPSLWRANGRGDGKASLIDTPGYHADSGYLYRPRIEFKPLGENLTQDDAFEALTYLWDIFCDVPYERPEQAYVPIAAILSMLARPAIRGCVPCFVFDANASGSGKSMQTDCVSIIATGRHIEKLNFPGDNDWEVEKRLAGLAVRGASLISWDNLSPSVPFSGSTLEATLTAWPNHSFRVLGKDDLIARVFRLVQCASGNQVLLGSEDVRRRSLVARIVTNLENPERRSKESYTHPERMNRLEEHCMNDRANLVKAGLTVLKAFIDSGTSERSTLMASFGAWSNIVPSAILWAGGPDIVDKCRPISVESEPPEKRAMRVLLESWATIERGAGSKGFMTSAMMINVLWPAERMRGQAAPDGFDEQRTAIEELTDTKAGYKPSGKALGEAFARWKDKTIGVHTLRLLKSDPSHGNRWSLSG